MKPMRFLCPIALAAMLLMATTVRAQSTTAPGARPANTTAAQPETGAQIKPARVKPTKTPTDPTAAMETTAPVDRNGAVPAERAARRKNTP